MRDPVARLPDVTRKSRAPSSFEDGSTATQRALTLHQERRAASVSTSPRLRFHWWVGSSTWNFALAAAWADSEKMRQPGRWNTAAFISAVDRRKHTHWRCSYDTELPMPDASPETISVFIRLRDDRMVIRFSKRDS
ncbi:hypothetical protein [Prosthecobacter sp.]|uniref:hypothetical protein n=1 Tax=Prosthecobacter sp. TaxID=1965333 RepID=UPI003784C7A2